MSVSTVEAPQGAASQEAYFDRNKEWAVSGANWSEAMAAATMRIDVGLGLVAFPTWLYWGNELVDIHVKKEWL